MEGPGVIGYQPSAIGTPAVRHALPFSMQNYGQSRFTGARTLGNDSNFSMGPSRPPGLEMMQPIGSMMNRPVMSSGLGNQQQQQHHMQSMNMNQPSRAAPFMPNQPPPSVAPPQQQPTMSKLNPNAPDFSTKMQPPNMQGFPLGPGSNRLQFPNQHFTSRPPPMQPSDLAHARRFVNF
jgi:hypothetical protein